MTTEAALTHHLAVAQSDVAAALVAARPLVDRHIIDTPTGRVMSEFTGHDAPVVTHLAGQAGEPVPPIR